MFRHTTLKLIVPSRITANRESLRVQVLQNTSDKKTVWPDILNTETQKFTINRNIYQIVLCKCETIIEPRHVISNNVAF